MHVIVYGNHDPRYEKILTRLEEAGISYTYCDDADVLHQRGYVSHLPRFELDGKVFGLSTMLEIIAKYRIKNGEMGYVYSNH